MATHSQITSFLQHAVSLYLAGDMDNERYQFEHGDKSFSYVNCEFQESTNRLNHQGFDLIVDGSRYVVTVSKPRNAA